MSTHGLHRRHWHALSALMLSCTIGLAFMALSNFAAAGPPDKDSQHERATRSAQNPSIPTLCPALGDSLHAWFEENADIFTSNVDMRKRPRTLEVCYRNGVITVSASWDIGEVAVQRDEMSWQSEFFLYYPHTKGLTLYMNTPIQYLSQVVANYWSRSTEYPQQTVWLVELRNDRSGLLRTAYFDKRGRLISTGEIFVAVEPHEPQLFRARIRRRAAQLSNPRAPNGELTRQGLVFKFFDLPIE